mmetsp:Transcript_41685/g.116138  ORF Transcript_41685/g.116138 Transcript_41685/m.116138 type:complete len:343 (-) Transcript_41685:1045-2073(-)
MDRRQAALRPASPELREARLLLQRSGQRRHRVPLPELLRSVPPSHYRITDELPHNTAMRHDDAAHLVQVLPKHVHECLRVHALGQGGEADDVAEEHRDRGPGDPKAGLPPALHQHAHQTGIHVPREGPQPGSHVREGIPDVRNLLDVRRRAAHEPRAAADAGARTRADAQRMAPAALVVLNRQHVVHDVELKPRHCPHVILQALQWPRDGLRDQKDDGRLYQQEEHRDEDHQRHRLVQPCFQHRLRLCDVDPAVGDCLLEGTVVDLEGLHVHDDPLQVEGAGSALEELVRVNVAGPVRKRVHYHAVADVRETASPADHVVCHSSGQRVTSILVRRTTRGLTI